METLDRIYEDYKNGLVDSIETQRLLNDNRIFAEKSGLSHLIDCLVTDASGKNFVTTVKNCKTIYLLFTLSLDIGLKDFSFRNYINECIKTPKNQERFNEQIREQGKEEHFWSLVEKVSRFM